MEINGDKRSHMFLRLSRNHFKNVTVFCQKRAELGENDGRKQDVLPM